MQPRRGWLVLVAWMLALGAAFLPFVVLRALVAAAGAWVLARELGLARRGAALAAIGFAGSGAVLFGGLGPSGERIGLVPLGMVLVATALVIGWRSAGVASDGPRWAGAAGVVLAVCACAYAGMRGTPWALAWVAAPVLLLALASCFSKEGELRHRVWIQLAGLGALLASSLHPIASVPAALLLSLCAADALRRSDALARSMAALSFVALALFAFVAARPAEFVRPKVDLDAPDQWVRWDPSVPAQFAWSPVFAGSGKLAFSADVDAHVKAAAVELVLQEFGADGQLTGVELAFPMRGERGAASVHYLHVPIAFAGLPEGNWSVTLRLEDAGGERMGERVLTAFRLQRAPPIGSVTLCFVCAALVLFALLDSAAWVAFALCALALFQSAWLAWSALSGPFGHA